jgi:lysylphosphatidylglycerol synthetase-like protein (DUF2156 family)
MTSLSVELRVPLLRQHGSFTQAFSATFQPGLLYFGDARGFIAYKMVGRTAFALADPMTAPEHSRDLITRFVSQLKDVCFMQTQHSTAEILASLGFMVNEMGTESRIDLATHNFAGRKYRAFRLAVNRLNRSGFTIREMSLAEVGEETVKKVSAFWRRTRTVKSRELAFLNRPIVFADETDVRKFFTFDAHGRLVAFTFYDPIYENGSIVGYLEEHRRRLPETDPLINYAITQHAANTFRREGLKWMFLGCSPLADIEDKEFAHNWTVRRGFRFIYENWLFNRYFFPLKGLAAHKRSYGAETDQTYFAFNTLPALPRLIKALRATGII